MLVFIVVLLGSSLFAGLVAVFAWHSLRPIARIGADGFQEMTIRVEGDYRPSSFRARAALPLRIHFVRDEDQLCSDRVFIPDFGIERRLAAHRTTIVEVPPADPGNFLFTCQNGIYIGLISVRPRNSLAMLIGMSAPGRGLRARFRRVA